MLTLRWALGAIVAASAVSASTDELQFFSRLLKRQDPGTPEYNCHDNCGQAIIQARNSDDVCTDDIFLTDYQNCLQCSGPDNVDIWRYYGGTLTTAASSCGLSTTPLSGEQPDVGPAIPAGGSDDTTTSEEATSSATSAPTTATTATEEAPTTTATSTAEEESSAAPTTTATTATGDATEAPTSTAEGSPSETQETTATTGYATELPTSTGESVSETSTDYVTSSATDSGYVTLAPSATQGGNGTTATTTSSVAQVTNAANALSGSSVGFYGALALGAWYAVAQ